MRRLLAIGVTAALLLALAAPCPPPAEGALTASHARAAAEPADGAAAASHAPAPYGPWLSAPCPCGCGEQASGAAQLHGLGWALLLARPVAAADRTTHPLCHAGVSAPRALSGAIDHVPLAA